MNHMRQNVGLPKPLCQRWCESDEGNNAVYFVAARGLRIRAERRRERKYRGLPLTGPNRLPVEYLEAA